MLISKINWCLDLTIRCNYYKTNVIGLKYNHKKDFFLKLKKCYICQLGHVLARSYLSSLECCFDTSTLSVEYSIFQLIFKLKPSF